MKRLKFVPPLPELILSGEKTTTWRVDDDKDLQAGDEISLQTVDGTEFARAKIVLVYEKTFGAIDANDREGHENIESTEEMYKIYSNLYKKNIGPETLLKIVRFELV